VKKSKQISEGRSDNVEEDFTDSTGTALDALDNILI